MQCFSVLAVIVASVLSQATDCPPRRPVPGGGWQALPIQVGLNTVLVASPIVDPARLKKAWDKVKAEGRTGFTKAEYDGLVSP
jgi:hypothetical protein